MALRLQSDPRIHCALVRTSIDVAHEDLVILLVDDDVQRSDAVVSSLHSHGYQCVHQIQTSQDLLTCVRQVQPDVILMDIDAPNRDTLEQIARVSRDAPRPVVMFTLKDDRETVEAAIHAGVSAYLVNELVHARVRPIIEVAIARFRDFQNVSDELARTRTTLEERKAIDRAKGIIMQERGMPEPQAYALLRKLAMDQKKKLADVARELLQFHSLMKRP